MKTVILDADTVTGGDVSLSPITDICDCEIYGFSTDEELIDRIGDAEAVLTNKCRITREVMDACRNLKFIGVFATGYNNIDIVAAKEKGICVCNVPGYSTDSVAQHTFALILHHYSSIAKYADTVANGDWVYSKLFTYFNIPFYELSGKTLGIVGYGAIGKKVAKIALAFGMKVLIYTRTAPQNDDTVEVVSLDELMTRSDVVTLHCPLTDKTEKMINERTLSLMKEGSLLINTSRGGVIDEPALATALKNGKPAAAGLDVLTLEPMREDCVLRGLDN
ncbi:MAG: D-2-hydroxyacid dehydrogenase, partial [Oscillospiraceae bacterium]|nr:D-2-hydroxyacid dehydrogenase [Oscillospiraceae bacterium]